DCPGRRGRGPGLHHRAPGLHRPGRTQRHQPRRRRARTPATPGGPGDPRGRARRAGGAGRFQPGRLHFRARFAAGADPCAVPGGAGCVDGAAAAIGRRAGAAVGGRRPARRDNPGAGRRREGTRACGAAAAAGRLPPPFRARGRHRARLRRTARIAVVPVPPIPHAIRATARPPTYRGPMKFFVSCAKGLEYLLADELVALGASRATAAVAGANAEGSLADAQRAVLWSRLASRVLWPLASFDCPDERALYDGAAAVAWTEHLAEGQTLAVDAHVSGYAITHARFAAQRVKDAVVDVFRAQGLERPSVDVDAPDLRLNLSLRKGRATLSVDLGGGALHRRGWRSAQHEAPLKENLAAAVLLRGGWPQLYAEGGALLDPMCGSGTLLIEGALMAADVAPGLGRMQATLE